MDKDLLKAISERFRRAAREAAQRASEYEGEYKALYLGQAFAFHDCANMLEAFAEHPEWEGGLRALEAVLRSPATGGD